MKQQENQNETSIDDEVISRMEELSHAVNDINNAYESLVDMCDKLSEATEENFINAVFKATNEEERRESKVFRFWHRIQASQEAKIRYEIEIRERGKKRERLIEKLGITPEELSLIQGV